jgi:hypothetical protein
MIAFVGAVRHPLNCNSYDRVLVLLEATLLSICSQTNNEFKVIIACNEIIQFDSPLIRQHVEFVVVNFPPPSHERSAKTGREAIRKDRSTKYVVGILAAQRFEPDYIMIFDTDDYVSPEIAEFANRHSDKSRGWYIEKGYVMDHQDERRLWMVKDFHKICGTSLIIRNDLLVEPKGDEQVEITTETGSTEIIYPKETILSGRITPTSTQDEIFAQLDNVFLHYILGAHRWTADYYKLMPLPFPGAIWNWNTGENHGDIRRMTPWWQAFQIDEPDPFGNWIDNYR